MTVGVERYYAGIVEEEAAGVTWPQVCGFDWCVTVGVGKEMAHEGMLS
jgi:hypothetical protein